MWSRRAFMQSSLLAAIAGSARAADRGPLGRPIGIQIYTVREAAAKDLPGTLKQLAEIGYGEIELAGGAPLRPANELRTLLNDHGLTCPSMHASMYELANQLEEKIAFAQAVGVPNLVCSFPWTADSRFRGGNPGQSLAAGITLDDWKWNADQLNRAGELARKAGVRIGYHNHNMEFRSYDGVIAFDELMRLTDPMLVTIELDIAWVVTASANPLHYLAKYADRISMLHVKEVSKDVQVSNDRLQAQTTELGAGKIDWPQLFKALNPDRIHHYFVEQENFERAPLESARINFQYLRSLNV